VVLASLIVLALTLHRSLVRCSYLGTTPPPCANPTDYPVILRVAIIAGGFVIATLTLIIVRLHARRKSQISGSR